MIFAGAGGKLGLQLLTCRSCKDGKWHQDCALRRQDSFPSLRGGGGGSDEASGLDCYPLHQAAVSGRPSETALQMFQVAPTTKDPPYFVIGKLLPLMASSAQGHRGGTTIQLESGLRKGELNVPSGSFPSSPSRPSMQAAGRQREA